MNVKPILLLGGAAGLLALLSSKGRTGVTSIEPVSVVPAENSKPRAVPPYTINPKGRYMTDFEREVLRNTSQYITDDVMNTAKLWFERPKSSFTDEHASELGVTTQALTTQNGIYFPFTNHEFDSSDEFSLLAHELVHWNQFLNHTNAAVEAVDEVPAYQTQISVKSYLDQHLDNIRSLWAEDHPGWA